MKKKFVKNTVCPKKTHNFTEVWNKRNQKNMEIFCPGNEYSTSNEGNLN